MMPVLVGLGAFALAVLLHGLAMRVPAKLDSVRRFLLVGTPVGLALVAAALVAYGFTLRAIGPILLYAFLCEFYIFLFTMALISVSANLLVALLKGPVEKARFKSDRNAVEMVQPRIDRLLNLRLLLRSGDHLVATGSGRQLERGFTVLRRLFGLDA